MDDNNELTIYILQQLRQGVPEHAVRAILTQNGWPQPLVDRAFSMVQQARPHQVTPPDLTPTVAPAQPQPIQTQLPTPAVDPRPVIEGEKKLERRSNLRRHALIATLIVVLLTVIAAGVFFFTQQNDTPATEKPATNTSSMDEQRKDTVDKFADELIAYYESKDTYPTFDSIITPDFALGNEGLDTTKYQDPKWDVKNTACTDASGRAVLANARTKGCLAYRVTALSGEDCDAEVKKCTRVVVTANLENNKPYILVLDRNSKE
jgi:hypothetical protein